MARLQRKKTVSIKKKKKGDGAAASDMTVAASTKPSNKSAIPLAKKKAPMPARRGGGPTKGESSGKIKGLVDQSIQFLREVKVELKKVAWPSRKQTIGSTVVVLALVFIISAFLGIVDMGLSKLVRLVLQ